MENDVVRTSVIVTNGIDMPVDRRVRMGGRWGGGKEDYIPLKNPAVPSFL